jgi:hypothetical protein
MVVIRAANVVVEQRQRGTGRLGQRLSIQVVLQDRFDRAIVGGADGECAGAGRFQPCFTVMLGEPQNAQARAKALLRMAPGARMCWMSAVVVRPMDCAQRTSRSNSRANAR